MSDVPSCTAKTIDSDSMRTITINIKYEVGDKVWIMSGNYPTRLKIIKVKVLGGTEDKDGQTSNLGLVLYTLENDPYTDYTEEELCDTFEQLRDRVFSENLKDQ